MKRVGHLFDQVTELDNLLLAYTKARRGKCGKKEVLHFSRNVFGNIHNIKVDLENGSFRVGKYHYFKIHDPKGRTICAASFEERVCHHALMQVCHPVFERYLTADTYATRLGMGGYAALAQALRMITRYHYVAKLDFRKYFDSVSHDVLKSMLRRIFKDAKLIDCFERIINSYEVSSGCGLPIGNLTSQYFANHYLSGLDHKVKGEWHVPGYVRYMDDMLLASDDKEVLKHAVNNLRIYAEKELFLSLKPVQYRRSVEGVCFLGYRLLPHHMRLSSKAKRRYMLRYKDYAWRFRTEQWSENDFCNHVMTLHAFVAHACYKKFYKDCILKERIKGLTV